MKKIKLVYRAEYTVEIFDDDEESPENLLERLKKMPLNVVRSAYAIEDTKYMHNFQ